MIYDEEKWPERWEPVLDVTDNVYWRRVWVQQEFEYASQVVIHCRDVAMEHEHFVRFFKTAVPWFYRKEADMDEEHARKWKKLVYSYFIHFRESKQSNASVAVNLRRFYNIYDALQSGVSLSVTDERDR
jgi:hypothetical protein